MKEKKKEQNVRPLESLAMFESGLLTININGLPILEVDAESRSVDIEVEGARKCGIGLSEILELQSGQKGLRSMLKSSASAAKVLHEKRWRLTVYDNGSKVFTMGRGVSRLTGYMRTNPLKLFRVLKSL